MELAAELLEVTDDAELDLFLGSLIKRAGKAVGKIVKSPTGQVLGSLLKGAAKKYLPIAGGAFGNLIAPGLGGVVGTKLASNLGGAFGLELEGLSPEDQEFEAARGFVRFASEAAKNAALAPPGAPSQAAAREAVVNAAQQHAPGLLRTNGRNNRARNGGLGRAGTRQSIGSARTGRWVRRGRKIILYGV